MWLQKISILPPQKGLEIPEQVGGGVGGGFSKAQKFNLFCGSGGGMENFWNHTIFFSTYWSCTLQIINFTIGEIKEKLRFSPIIFGVFFFLFDCLWSISGIILVE